MANPRAIRDALIGAVLDDEGKPPCDPPEPCKVCGLFKRPLTLEELRDQLVSYNPKPHLE